jgi:thiol-disulfide isomerase/thioredoxin
MRITYRFTAACRFSLCLTGLVCLLVPPAPAADAAAPGSSAVTLAPDEFNDLGKAVLQLLQDRNSDQFTTNTAEAAANWQSISTNGLPAPALEQLQKNAQNCDNSLARLQYFTKDLLDRSDALHLDFSKGNWHFQVIAPPAAMMVSSTSLVENLPALPEIKRLEIVLTPDATSTSSTNGNYTIVVSGLKKFPAGWRIDFPDYIQWTSLPTAVADAKTLHNLKLMEKAVNNAPISGQDDPGLTTLAETLIRTIQQQDAGIYHQDALFTPDMLYGLLGKLTPGRTPPRDEFDKTINAQLQSETQVAQTLLDNMKDAGIDFSHADLQLKEAKVERSQSLGAPGSLDGLEGEQFEVTFAVKTDAKAKTGVSLAGDYTLMINQISRYGSEWRAAENLHWMKLPAGVIDAQAAARMDLENYVAAHNTLPPGMTAPDINLTALADSKQLKLSDLKGKVVILDFWASWCSPCQPVMAELQTIRQTHPDWQDKVVIAPLSIDDTIDIIRKHVDKRHWTNTFNVWAGDGGWNSDPAKQFRLKAVPTTYIIDAQGKIASAGNPALMPIADTVDRLLKQ